MEINLGDSSFYIDLFSTCTFNDTRTCILLWWNGSKKKCFKYINVFILYLWISISNVGFSRLFIIFW